MAPVPRIGPKRPQQLWLAEWRIYKGLTQEQLAGRLGVDKATVSRWEGGRRGVNLNVLAAISEALGEPVAAIQGPPPAETPSGQSDQVSALAAELASIIRRYRR